MKMMILTTPIAADANYALIHANYSEILSIPSIKNKKTNPTDWSRANNFRLKKTLDISSFKDAQLNNLNSLGSNQMHALRRGKMNLKIPEQHC